MPTRTCRPGIAPDADGGGFDAGRDAGPGMDAGPNADAGVPDEGGVDASLPDAAIDDTRCDDLHAGAIFCDGFEGADGFARWTSRYMAGATLAPSATQTFLGAGSLHAQVMDAGGSTAVRRLLDSPITSGDIYLRAWVYLPGSFTITGSFSLLQAGYDASPWYHLSIGISATGLAEIFIDSEAGARSPTGALVPRDTWVCMEAHVAIANTGGVAELWMNGTLEAQVTDFDTQPALGYERIVAGIPYTDAAQAATEVYLDEIVLSTTRVGCD